MIDLWREICKGGLKLDFKAHMASQNLDLVKWEVKLRRNLYSTSLYMSTDLASVGSAYSMHNFAKNTHTPYIALFK